MFCPDETASNRLESIFEATARCLCGPLVNTDTKLSADGRVMEVLSEHLCEGWLEGYLLSGRHGMFATYEAFAMVSASMAVQHVKWLQHAMTLDWRAPVSSLNVLLTSTCWRNDHNGFSHQGPGLIDALIPLAPDVVRVWLPPDANTTLSIADHCLRSVDHVNLIVVDKQNHLQYLTLEEANRHCAAGRRDLGLGRYRDDGAEPDIVLACAGDVPTQETLAAAELLREHTPDLGVRVVNVVDLMALLPRERPPARVLRQPVRGAVHPRPARGVRLPRVPAGGAPADPRAQRTGPVPRAGVQRAGHDHHPVRHGGAQPDEPVPPGPRGAAPIHPAGQRMGRPDRAV